MPSPPALELDQVRCTFASRDDASQRYTAVQDVTLTVAAGEFVSVVGPTGCGKSTLLNVAAGLLAPSSGSVRVFGQPLAGINTRAGYMFQSESLMPWRTALGNVMAGLEFRGVAGAQALAEDWLRRVGLGGFGNRYPHQLSGGMRKRTSLAQTLALDPDIILMDEPFSALDVQTRQLMENEVLEIWAGGSASGSAGPERSPPGGPAHSAAGGHGSASGSAGPEHSPAGAPAHSAAGGHGSASGSAGPEHSPAGGPARSAAGGHGSGSGSAGPERSPSGGPARSAAGGHGSGSGSAGPERSPSGGPARSAVGGQRKAVLFITHDLDEAIAMSDRVVVLSAGPASRPIGEFRVDLERPRDVAEVRNAERFLELHRAIWSVLRDEVLKGYAQQLERAA